LGEKRKNSESDPGKKDSEFACLAANYNFTCGKPE